MVLFSGNKWDKAKMVPSSELLSRITGKHPSVGRAPDALNDTARNYLIPGYEGSFGFISSMSDHFCGSCNRLRLTADGQIKVCFGVTLSGPRFTNSQVTRFACLMLKKFLFGTRCDEERPMESFLER